MNSDYINVAIDTARKAGSLLKQLSEEALIVEEKGSAFDFVTNADTASQKLVQDALHKFFPSHYFVGEEDGKTDKDVADFLYGLSPSEYCWICDPLDGTMNYIHHLNGYAVSIALYNNGRILAGVTYTPVEDELFCAELGCGAKCNGVPMHVSEVSELSQAFTTTGIPPTNMEWREISQHSIDRVTFRTVNTRIIGCATRAIACVAAGRFDAYWEVGPHPWDSAAGSLMVSEAGGNIQTFYGSEYRFGEPKFMATNGRIDKALIEAIDWPR